MEVPEFLGMRAYVRYGDYVSPSSYRAIPYHIWAGSGYNSVFRAYPTDTLKVQPWYSNTQRKGNYYAPVVRRDIWLDRLPLTVGCLFRC